MILIWQGAGILVAAIWFLSIFAGDRLARAVFGLDVSGGLCNLTGEWLAATLTLGLALLVRKQGGPRLDPDSGQAVEVSAPHSLFFIPVIAWPVIFFGIGIITYFHAPEHAPAPIDDPPRASTKVKQPVSGGGAGAAGEGRVQPGAEDGKAAAREDTVRRLKELARKSKAALEQIKESASKPKGISAKE